MFSVFMNIDKIEQMKQISPNNIVKPKRNINNINMLKKK